MSELNLSDDYNFLNKYSNLIDAQIDSVQYFSKT